MSEQSPKFMGYIFLVLAVSAILVLLITVLSSKFGFDICKTAQENELIDLEKDSLLNPSEELLRFLNVRNCVVNIVVKDSKTLLIKYTQISDAVEFETKFSDPLLPIVTHYVEWHMENFYQKGNPEKCGLVPGQYLVRIQALSITVESKQGKYSCDIKA